MPNTRRLILSLTLILSQVSLVMAESSDAFQFFQEEAKVSTASRREQTIREVPMAVDVITPEEILASGAVNIWDLLRFRVGMDVLDGRSGDGLRAIVSERGFPHEFAGTLLLLVDGRNVYDTNSAAIRWEEIPVQLQDIERIEIIRGPNTALYGTGAGVGVVNIITKKPEGKTALELDNRGGNRGLVQSFQAVEGAVQKLAFRVSHTFQEMGGFPTFSDPGTKGDDFLHKNVANIRAVMPLSEQSNVEVLSGGSWETMGLGGAAAAQRGDFHNDFEMLKFSHQFSSDNAVEATSARSNRQSDAPSGNFAHDRRQIQYDYEAMHRFAWLDRRLHTTYGTSYRNVHVNSEPTYGSHQPRLEIYRGYLQQAAQMTEQVSMQGAVSLESSSMAGLKPNYQLSSIYAPTLDHAFRVSYSVAHVLRDFVPVYADMVLGGFLRFLGNRELGAIPIKITSYETGYNGSYLDKRLQADATLFYTKLDNNHQTFLVLPPPSPPLVTVRFDTYDDAIARGAELSLKYRFARSRWIYANYMYEHITDTAGDLPFITDSTPAHKLNFGGAADLLHGLSASINFGYKDAYLIQNASRNTPVPVPAYWRMDTRIAYRLPWYQDAELYVAGQNLLESNHVEFADGLTVPRTYQGGISVKFGGK